MIFFEVSSIICESSEIYQICFLINNGCGKPRVLLIINAGPTGSNHLLCFCRKKIRELQAIPRFLNLLARLDLLERLSKFRHMV